MLDRRTFRVRRILLGVAIMAIGVGIFAEVWRNPQAYQWRQASLGREPHWVVDVAFFVVIYGLWHIDMALPRTRSDV